jgi:hypothetical protein
MHGVEREFGEQPPPTLDLIEFGAQRCRVVVDVQRDLLTDDRISHYSSIDGRNSQDSHHP